MNYSRQDYIRKLDSLTRLADHTTYLSVNEYGRVVVEDKLPAPVDEYGIPRAEIHIEQLLGAMSTKDFIWTGVMDVHHLCTPKADFTVVRTPGEGDLGSAFRGMSRNKIEKPRLLHNFGHAIVELPGRPSFDVMRQALFEVGQGRQLMEIINSHMTEQMQGDIDRTKELCLRSLRIQLESMCQPEVGMMPSLDELASLEFDELQVAVRGIVSIRRFGNKRLIHPAVRKDGGGSRYLVGASAA